MIAVTNSAVDSSWTARMSQLGRDDRQVRQEREAEDDPGEDPGRRASSRRSSSAGWNTASPADGEHEPDEPAERGAQEADVPDHEVLD